MIPLDYLRFRQILGLINESLLTENKQSQGDQEHLKILKSPKFMLEYKIKGRDAERCYLPTDLIADSENNE